MSVRYMNNDKVGILHYFTHRVGQGLLLAKGDKQRETEHHIV